MCVIFTETTKTILIECLKALYYDLLAPYNLQGHEHEIYLHSLLLFLFLIVRNADICRLYDFLTYLTHTHVHRDGRNYAPD